jgi:acyl-CoA synthetase (AMP-forming)/AMP-acid ligase II
MKRTRLTGRSASKRSVARAFGIPVVETYGMTEAASMITVNPLDGPRKAGSVGLPAGAEVRVVLAPGAVDPVGRVQIRGRVITEYAAGGPAGAFDPRAGSTPAVSGAWTPMATCSWPGGPTT